MREIETGSLILVPQVFFSTSVSRRLQIILPKPILSIDKLRIHVQRTVNLGSGKPLSK